MFLPVVIHLLESGASISMQDTNGKTPIDVAINPQISFLLRRHKQRLEHFEFTSKERQWYRRMRINQWETVNHTELWQEVVHLLVLQKHEQIDQAAGVGNTLKTSGRPQSKRSRAGGISDARMERIRRIQKSAHSSDDSGTTIIGESHFSTDGNRINVDEPTDGTRHDVVKISGRIVINEHLLSCELGERWTIQDIKLWLSHSY